MDDTYEHKIGHTGFEPETIYAKMVALGNRVSDLCNVNLHNQEAVLENHILQCLARMRLFRNEEVPEETGEAEEKFLELKQALIRKDLPADATVVLRSCREIVQHAKAA
ncbi:hypothetical protein N7467_002188 [Penicillium canescens]|nr:hypothetical protein N7467_002188 [Penicillium canescens]